MRLVESSSERRRKRICSTGSGSSIVTAAAAAAAVLLSIGVAPAEAGPAPPAASDTARTERPVAGASSVALPFELHTLPNGLRILALEDHSVPSITYWTWFHVGSINERPGITGVSHLFEHLMFRGAKRFGPGEFDKALESNGGYSNAFTDKDVTAYYENLISEKLELAIDLDSDRMASLNVTQEVLDPEREVVKEERRLRSENNILGAMDEVLDAAAYLAHPYHWPVIGWMGDINNITVDDCHDYFRTYYAPNNATVIVVGDFKTKELLELIEKYYREIARQAPPRSPVNSEPRQRGQRRVVFYKKAEVETFGTAFQAPAADAPGFYATEVLQYILGSGRSSRLYKRLIYDAQIAANVNMFSEWRHHPGLLKIYVDMKPGHKASEGEKMLDEELTRIREQPVSETELQKAKNNIRAHFIRQMKTNQGKGEVVGTFEILWGDWAKHKEFLDKIDAVTVENVKEAAVRYLSDLNETVVTLIPQEPPGEEEPSGTASAQESGGEGSGGSGAASRSVGGGAVGEGSAGGGVGAARSATAGSGRSGTAPHAASNPTRAGRGGRQ